MVLQNTRRYFEEEANEDPNLQREGILGDQGVTVADVTKTLDFMITTLEEDLKNNAPIRLQNTDFLNKNFRVISWQAFNPKATRQRNIRLTKYAVFTHPGSRTRTDKFNIGLYALKPESVAEGLHLKYTKQEVLNNIYEEGGPEFGKVEPLVYLDREGLESALMEGTIRVSFPDGTSALYNVDRSNNIPFVKGLDRRQQKRYWYFKPVDEIKGYGHRIDKKISVKPRVTFAGDILNIGLGKIVAIQYVQGGKSQMKLGMIADTGGAFLPNLYQLDFLSGVFETQQDYLNYVRTLPEYVKAYILIKK